MTRYAAFNVLTGRFVRDLDGNIATADSGDVVRSWYEPNSGEYVVAPAPDEGTPASVVARVEMKYYVMTGAGHPERVAQITV